MIAGRFTTLLRGRNNHTEVVMIKHRNYWVLVVVVVVVPVLEPSPPPVAASATPTAELTVLVLAAVELPADADVAADPAASPTWTGAA